MSAYIAVIELVDVVEVHVPSNELEKGETISCHINSMVTYTV